MRTSLFKLILIGGPALVLLGVGCPMRVPSPPPDDQGLDITVVDGEGKPVTGIRQKHVIGQSPCPTRIAPLKLEVKGDDHPPKAKPKTDAKWLTLPDEVAVGEWFIPLFNCDISDYTPHEEEADVTFEWEFGDEPPEDAPSVQHTFDLEDYNRFDVKLDARANVCTSGDGCRLPALGLEDAPSRSHGVDSVTWARECSTPAECNPAVDASAGTGKGIPDWFGTQPNPAPAE